MMSPLTFFLIMIFYRAANLGNPEALIKLGLAHLYNEGSESPIDFCVQIGSSFTPKRERFYVYPTYST